jgi:protein-tyrosine phosphatase
MFLDNGQRSLAHILGSLARPGIFPAVIHCRIGKDRTGLLTALLLELAGVPRETVVEDYALTCPEIQQLLATETEIAVSDGRDRAQFERLMECDASVIARTLAYLDERYGGAERYARAIGFKDAALRSLRAALAQEP